MLDLNISIKEIMIIEKLKLHRQNAILTES